MWVRAHKRNTDHYFWIHPEAHAHTINKYGLDVKVYPTRYVVSANPLDPDDVMCYHLTESDIDDIDYEHPRKDMIFVFLADMSDVDFTEFEGAY